MKFILFILPHAAESYYSMVLIEDNIIILINLCHITLLYISLSHTYTQAAVVSHNRANANVGKYQGQAHALYNVLCV